jgi:hypothetical protein
MHAQGDFADRLQRCIERSERANGDGAKVVNGDEGGAMKVIEGRVEGSEGLSSKLRRI